MFTSAVGSGLQLWPSRDPEALQVILRSLFFSSFSHKKSHVLLYSHWQALFLILCLFMIIQKDVVGFFEHLRLVFVCAISMWAFITETCCVQPLYDFNFQKTAPAVVRCQTFTEMFLMVFLRWHHGSLLRPLWVSTVQLCCFSRLLLFHCE